MTTYGRALERLQEDYPTGLKRSAGLRSWLDRHEDDLVTCLRSVDHVTLADLLGIQPARLLDWCRECGHPAGPREAGPAPAPLRRALNRVALYARVSTDDEDQNPSAQLQPLRSYSKAQGWELTGEYVDKAPAGDLGRRVRWHELLADAGRRRFDLVVVFRLDRSFRSVLDAAATLELLRGWRVGFRSYGEPWLDTTTPFGEALYHITAAYAQLERSIIGERDSAGIDRAGHNAAKLGQPIGQP